MSSPPDVDDTWRHLRGTAPEVLDRDGCKALLSDVRRVRAWVDAAELRATRRMKELEAQGVAEPAEAALANDAGLSGRDARDAADREQAAAELPEFEDALEVGQVTAGHLDVLAAVLSDLSDVIRVEFTDHQGELLAAAAKESVDAFRRQCRRLVKVLIAAHGVDDDVDELALQRRAVKIRRWVDQATGMHHSHLELDPVRDATLWTAVNALLNTMRAQIQAAGDPVTSFNQLQADALVEAVSSNRGDHGAGRRVPEIGVLIGLDMLRGDANAAGICETVDGVHLPVDTVRRMCCDADIYPAVLGGPSERLDLGRSARTATAKQRAALATMYSACAHPDCTVGFSATRAHHINFWTRDHGPTDIDNLIPLCERHHHLVHEGKWTLTMTADRVATWRLPNGTIYHHGTSINRTHSAA